MTLFFKFLSGNKMQRSGIDCSSTSLQELPIVKNMSEMGSALVLITLVWCIK